MKRFNRILRTSFPLVLLLFSFFLSSCAESIPETAHHISFQELGIPTKDDYPEGDIAHAPWDVIFYDGRLYIGSGDYDKNAGPVSIYSYHKRRKKWQSSASLPEEEISRFILADGTLYALGIDPKESWSFGNFYTPDDEEWIQHRTIPNGIHTFDMVEFDGALFAGLGVPSGKFPVVRSEDEGESFFEVPFEKDGKRLDTSLYELIRAHDLIVFNDILYAILSSKGTTQAHELYRYDEARNTFLYTENWETKLSRIKYNHMRITAKETVDDTLYLVTGKLYKTSDMQTMTEISLPDTKLVCDLYKDDDELYVLCAAKATAPEQSGFKTSVYKLYTGDEGTFFTELFNFFYDIPALSLAVDGDIFFIGMADTLSPNEKNGMILKVEYTE